MDYIRNMFYRAIPANTVVEKPVTVDEETKNKLNLQNYKFDVEKFDKEVEAKCKQNMFYKYK